MSLRFNLSHPCLTVGRKRSWQISNTSSSLGPSPLWPLSMCHHLFHRVTNLVYSYWKVHRHPSQWLHWAWLYYSLEAKDASMKFSVELFASVDCLSECKRHVPLLRQTIWKSYLVQSGFSYREYRCTSSLASCVYLLQSHNHPLYTF